MRRLALSVPFIAAVVVAVLLTGSAQSSHRVAAIFDTANGIIPGNEVKIAGASVGTVDQVELAPGPKARVVMSVKAAMGHFYRNATCTILPEGLISENFVQCSPGSVTSGPLPRDAGGMPTVPVSHTTVPTSFQQLLDVFSLPTDDRIRVLIDELGIATAGRGEDLNALLRRSNPALAQAQRALSIVNAQRQQLQAGIAQTNQVLTALAGHSTSVTAFVDQAAAVARTTAEHRSSLGLAVHRLPGMLHAIRPSIASLDQAIRPGTTLLASLRTAAPALTEATVNFPAFASAGIPAIEKLAPVTVTARAAIHAATPVVDDLERASATAKPFSSQLDQLLVATRDAGGFEGVADLFYTFANSMSLYDSLSHITALILYPFPQCLGNTDLPGCDSRYTAPGAGTIPANDPACGPQPAPPWATPTSCSAVDFVPLARHRQTVRQASTPHASASRPAPAPTPTATQPSPSAPAGHSGPLPGLPKLTLPIPAPSTGVTGSTLASKLKSLLQLLLAP